MPIFNLRTKKGVGKLIDFMETQRPIEQLDHTIRQRLEDEGVPLTLVEAKKYIKLHDDAQFERNVFRKLLNQAPFFQK